MSYEYGKGYSQSCGIEPEEVTITEEDLTIEPIVLEPVVIDFDLD